MKTISEKAKAYDEVVEKLSKLYRDYDSVSNLIDVKEELGNILPEIKESKDERMCKVAIEACKYMVDNFENSTQQYTDAIAWLEKQAEHAKFRDSIQVGDKVTRNEDGVLVNLSQLKRVAKPAENKGEHDMGISEATKQELEDKLHEALEKETPESCNEFLDEQSEQKPADKVEPKFKVGDFIVNDYCMGRVVEITNDAYLLDTEQGIPFSCHSTRLWDITKDAEDGDVLYNKDDFAGNSVFIYKGISNKTHACLYYTRLFKDKDFRIYNDVMLGNGTGVKGGEFYPATKEQCDALMKAMADAGYTFDFEKKELKEVEQKPADTEKGAKGNDREIPNSVWSEEDEARFESCIKVLQTSDGYDTINAKWLKSLKDRVQPQQQEWSEKDERMFKNTIALIETLEDYNKAPNGFGDVKFWLKSLKDRYTWKPSDEQIKALANALSLAKNCGEESAFDLRTLYEQIKKLTE